MIHLFMCPELPGESRTAERNVVPAIGISWRSDSSQSLWNNGGENMRAAFTTVCFSVLARGEMRTGIVVPVPL